jgi:hypothetical protein
LRTKTQSIGFLAGFFSRMVFQLSAVCCPSSPDY